MIFFSSYINVVFFFLMLKTGARSNLGNIYLEQTYSEHYSHHLPTLVTGSVRLPSCLISTSYIDIESFRPLHVYIQALHKRAFMFRAPWEVFSAPCIHTVCADCIQTVYSLTLLLHHIYVNTYLVIFRTK